MAAATGVRDDSGKRGIRPRTILAPVFAWLVVACVVAVYLNQRGRWSTLTGSEAYRDCFGSPPAEGLRLLNAASFRHYRYTGELLAMECYVQAEAPSGSPGSDLPGAKGEWRDAPMAGGNLGLQARLDGRKLSRVPGWFLGGDLPDSARAREDDQGKWLYIRSPGSPRILIAGGWKTTGR